MAAPSTVTLTLERGLQILRAFRAERTALTHAELMRRTGLPRSSVSRLANTLVNLGYLRRVSGGPEFELGGSGFAIGSAYEKTNRLAQLAHPPMQRLADRLDVSVALAVPDQLDMLYVAYRNSLRIATLRLGVGSILPMGTTSIGHACLWASPPAERKRLLAGLRQRYGAHAAEVEASMQHSFEELEQAGTCAVMAGHLRDTYGVALPVRVGPRRIVMGLSCGKAGAPTDLSAERGRIRSPLREAAAELEELLADFDEEP